VKFQVTHILSVTPATFWGQLFFDRVYNEQLYQALGFANMQVLSLEEQADGVVRRVLRAEPPLHVPAVLKAKLQGKIFYTEDGSYDPARQIWVFRSIPSVVPDQVSITGRIQLSPHDKGALHEVDVEARVTAWGVGALIERVIERNTRDSLAVTTQFIDRWAREKGLS